jgi:DNA-3-methyladenine glycosylase II
MATPSLTDATREIARRDRVPAQAIARLGPLRYSLRDPDGPFGALVRAIIYQQLAGQAAQAIYTRVRAAVGPALTPESLAAVSNARLRRAGLSANKLASLRDLASNVSAGTEALTPSSVRTDDELIERLITVRGIGPWTAQMYLLFELRSLDVWPVVDLGVRQGYALIWSLPTAPEPTHLEELGEGFRPYRRIVARYWRAALAEQRTRPLPTPL